MASSSPVDAPKPQPRRACCIKPRRPRGFSLGDRYGSLCGLPLFGHGMALFAAGDERAAATMGEQEFGSVLGETKMTVFRLIAGVVGFACVAIAAMAVLGIGAEVRAELAPIAAKENPLDMVSSDGWACPRELWPYGCQWQGASVKRVHIRPSRPF